MKRDKRRIRAACAPVGIAMAILCSANGGIQAQAGTPGPLCGRDEVLRIVDRTVRGWNLYNRIVEGSAIESPTDTANAVICYASMSSVSYERTPEGWLPRPYRELRRYDVQVVGNRLFVQVAP